MNLFKKPVPRLEPLPPDPGLDDIFTLFAPACGGFIPNGMLIMMSCLAATATPNPALNLSPFGRWTALKRRRLALRYALRSYYP